MLITASEIIKKSWETYSKNWKILFPYMVLIFSSSVTLGLVGILGLQIEKFLAKGSLIFINNLFIAALTLALLLFSLWITIALTKSLKAIIEKKEIGHIKENMLQTSKYLWPIIWTSFLLVLAILGGFVLFIIPALIFAIWFVYYFYTVIFEEKKGVEALKSSKALVSGRWWKTLWLILAPSIFYGIIILVIQGAINYPLIFIFGEKTLTYVFTRSVLTTTISALFAPLSALTTLYLYLSAKANPVEEPLLPPTKIN